MRMQNTLFPQISAHALINALFQISANPFGQFIKQAPPSSKGPPLLPLLNTILK